MLASLNHPNIAIIHGLEESNGIHAIVLELVEGPTLAERLASAAGLAPRADVGRVLSASAKASADRRSLGEGWSDPPRSDRRPGRAFGCVLYEMLTGRRTFDGEDVTDVLARILKREPDFAALPAETPPAIRRLLRRSLEKDRKRRLPDIAVARIEIDEAQTPQDAEVTRAVEAPRRSRERAVAWTLAAVATAAAVALGVLYLRSAPATDAHSIRFAVSPPQNVTLGRAGGSIPAVSPDGRRVAFVANRGGATE